MPAQNPATRAAYEAVASEYLRPVQQAGLRPEIINLCANDARTPDELRRSLVRQLQRTLPAVLPEGVPRHVRADGSTLPNAEFARHEQQVREAVTCAAHASSTLRAVVTTDRAGREQTEYYGQKRGPGGWMEQFVDQPRLMSKIDGVPVGSVPVIF